MCGCIVSFVLLVFGKKPKKWNYSWYFQIGENWGGLELGPFFVRDTSSNSSVNEHEHGHGIQNCIFGPLMIPLICLPSMIRYWYRKICGARTPYDAIWFEGQATKFGEQLNHSLKGSKYYGEKF